PGSPPPAAPRARRPVPAWAASAWLPRRWAARPRPWGAGTVKSALIERELAANLAPEARLAIVGSASNRAPSLRWYLSVGFLLVGVAPLLFFGAQRVSALSGAQDDSVHQTHERLAATLAQAIYGFVLDQTAT